MSYTLYNIMRADNCCDMRGMLSFLILFMLSKKQMSGQDLANELTKRKGMRPSPGTIYPALKRLRNAKLIKERKDGKKIMYSLTDDGKSVLREAKKQFCIAFTDVFES